MSSSAHLKKALQRRILFPVFSCTFCRLTPNNFSRGFLGWLSKFCISLPSFSKYCRKLNFLFIISYLICKTPNSRYFNALLVFPCKTHLMTIHPLSLIFFHDMQPKPGERMVKNKSGPEPKSNLGDVTLAFDD